METIKFYIAQFDDVRYMGWRKATREVINEAISWINSHELHSVSYRGKVYGQGLPRGTSELVKAFKQ